MKNLNSTNDAYLNFKRNIKITKVERYKNKRCFYKRKFNVSTNSWYEKLPTDCAYTNLYNKIEVYNKWNLNINQYC